MIFDYIVVIRLQFIQTNTKIELKTKNCHRSRDSIETMRNGLKNDDKLML